jgi:hypothetical protein
MHIRVCTQHLPLSLTHTHTHTHTRTYIYTKPQTQIDSEAKTSENPKKGMHGVRTYKCMERANSMESAVTTTVLQLSEAQDASTEKLLAASSRATHSERDTAST